MLLNALLDVSVSFCSFPFPRWPADSSMNEVSDWSEGEELLGLAKKDDLGAIDGWAECEPREIFQLLALDFGE